MWTTIKTLKEQGYKNKKIAEILNINRKTICRILKKIASGQNEPKRKIVDSILKVHQDYIAYKVAKGLTAVRIYQDLIKDRQYSGSYDTVKRYVKKIKLSQDIFMHNPTIPAEEAQVDFGYAGLLRDIIDEKLHKSWIFCMELVHSNKSYYEIVFNQDVKTFLKCHINAFRYFCGVPKTVKIDNLKSAILKASFYETEYQKEYINFANYYGFKPIPCRIATPTDKASVECGIKYVKNNFLKAREFENIVDANKQLRYWQDNICNKRIHGTTKKVPDEVFEKEEKALLLPLPEKDYDISEWVKRTVSCTCHISYKNNFYSLPYQYVHQEVIVQITDKLLKVYADNKLVATHTLIEAKGKFQTNPSHYPEYKSIPETQLKEKYRQKMIEIGEDALRYFECLVKKQPGYWMRSVKGIIKLSDEYGKRNIDIACSRALHFGVYGYKVIKSICEKGLFEKINEIYTLNKLNKANFYEYQRPLQDYEKLFLDETGEV